MPSLVNCAFHLWHAPILLANFEAMAGKVVIFNDYQFNERGTSASTYNFADYNEKILGNKSLILVPEGVDGFSVDRFQSRFKDVIRYKSKEELYKIAKEADCYYTQVSGLKESDELDNMPCKTAVHCVFTAHDPHGSVYAAISPWLARTYALFDVPVVPLMVTLPESDQDLRAELGIPTDAVVFGRHGGYTEFNILPTMQVVAHAAKKREDLYFIFLNTVNFFNHPRIKFLPKTNDALRVTKFINTCDAMIHGRREGETFGLAVGEFSLKSKPIFSWFWSHDRHHIETLGQYGNYYRTPKELLNMFINFKKGTLGKDCYSALYNPELVMAEFERVFLS